MACNCKKTAENAGKYSDDGRPALEIVSGFSKILVFALRVFVSLLAVCLIIVILPFFLLYVLICMIFGWEIRLDLTKLFRRNGERK